MADCDHNWVYKSETPDTVTHRCSKCDETYTRPKDKNSAANLAYLAAAVVIFLATLAPIFLAGRVSP